jgi:hypothetical protein
VTIDHALECFASPDAIAAASARICDGGEPRPLCSIAPEDGPRAAAALLETAQEAVGRPILLGPATVARGENLGALLCVPIGLC